MKNKNSNKCAYCGESFDHLPFYCRRCDKYFCTKHRLPENHNCSGFKKGNMFKNMNKGYN